MKILPCSTFVPSKISFFSSRRKLWEPSPARDVDNYPWDYGALFYFSIGNENNSGPFMPYAHANALHMFIFSPWTRLFQMTLRWEIWTMGTPAWPCISALFQQSNRMVSYQWQTFRIIIKPAVCLCEGNFHSHRSQNSSWQTIAPCCIQEHPHFYCCPLITLLSVSMSVSLSNGLAIFWVLWCQTQNRFIVMLFIY